MNEDLERMHNQARQEPFRPARYLHSRGRSVPAAHPVGAQPGQDEEEEWRRAIRALQRHWLWSLTVAVAIPLGVAITVLLLMKPVYEPTAKIELAPPGNELFSLNPVVRWDSAPYEETQAKNLQTDQLAIAVIRKLRLSQNPEFVAPHSRTSQFLRRWFVALGRPTRTDPDGGELELTSAEREALKTFQRNLHVQRDTSSWLINISFEAHDPKLAALVTNTIVEQFLETNYRSQHDAIVQGTQWLSHQLDDIRGRLEESNNALAEFQRNIAIMGSPTGISQGTFDQRMLELSHQFTVAQADRVQLEALLQKVSPQNTYALPQVKADPVVQEIEKKLASAQVELRQALVTYGKSHPKTKELEAQIGELQEQLKEQQNTIFTSLKTAYAAAHKREDLLNSELKIATHELGTLAQYEALKREAQANETLYSTLYAKIKEASIAAESRPSSIRWVDRAQVLDLPNRPRRMLDIALGMLAGILAGVLVAFLREGLNNKVRTPDDVKGLTSVSTISLMPMIDAVEQKLESTPLVLGLKRDRAPSEVFLLERPASAESEALRGLFTSIRLSRPSHSPRVLLIASPLASEGKTTIAVNLSVALARQGVKTCIVDADLRNSRVARIFGIESPLGLTDVLQGSCVLDRAVVPSPGMENLMLLPGGISENAGELICSEHMRAVLGQLRAAFQFIIVDSPPILPYADGRAIAAFADGVILVCRSGVSTRQGLKRCLELLEQVCSAPVLELVLNGVDFSSSEYRYGYGYAYK